tara:strand:- start:1739 stop:2368 length:630 start_codon:yes stop_codon:yes gene_type:complete
MLDYLKSIKLTYIVIACLLLYVLFLQECDGPKKSNNDTIFNTTDTLSYTTDTFRITSIDTIFLPSTPVTVTVAIPTPVYIHDTLWKGDSAIVKTYAEYNTEVKDSLITGVINSKVEGVLISQDFAYTPLFPKYIWRIDTVVIENNTIVDEKKLFLFVGGEVGGNIDAFNLSPVIGVGTTKGNMYSYRYGLLDKTHNITFSKKLSFKLKR